MKAPPPPNEPVGDPAGQNLAGVLKRISDAFVALDKDWRYTYVNRKAGEMFSRRPEDLIGQQIWPEFPEGVGQPFHRNCEKALATQQPVFFEDYYAPWDRWFENRVYPSPDGLSIYFHDITGRKRAEALLNGQKQVLEMIAAGTSLPETLTALVRLIEAQAPGMLGSILLLDEAGIHVRHGAAPSLPPEYVAAIDGQPIGPCAGSCGTAAYRKEPVFVEDIATDPLWAVYKAAALPHGLRACWSTPIFDAQREVLGTFAMYYRQPALPQPHHLRLIDIATHTAAIAINRHRTETALRARTEELDRYFTNSLDLLCIADTDGHFRRLNPEWERALGYPVAELEGRRFLDLVHPEDLEATLAALGKLSSQEHVLNFVNRYRHRDGSYRWIEWRSYAADSRIYAVARDITERQRAEAALREREELLRQMSAMARIGGWEFDVATGRGTWTDEIARIHDLDPAAEPNVQLGLSFFHDESRRKIESAVSAAVELGQPYDLELEMVTANGNRKWVRTIGLPLKQGDRVIKVRGTMQDITERKRAEAALRASEEQLRNVLDGLGSQMFAGLLDPQGTVLLANRPALEAAALRSEEVLGRPVESTYWWTWSEAVSRRLRAAVERAAQGEPVRYDEQIRVAEGQLMWLDFSIQPLRDETGRIRFLVPSGLVITERKQAEEALRESEERLRLALDAAHMGTFDWDVPGNRITWSRWHEELWGFKPGEFGGTYEVFSERVHPDDLPGTNAEVARCMTARAPFQHEFRVVWPDGSVHWIGARGEFTFGADGQAVRMRGVVVEITERKRTEEALHELSARLLTVQDEERRRLARELHDTTAQHVAALVLNLAALQNVPPKAAARAEKLRADCLALAEQTGQEIRTLAYLLHPPLLDAVGLAGAARDYAHGFGQRSGIAVAVDAPDDFGRLPPAAELALFRVVQESLANVLRHANSPTATIRLAHAGHFARVEVQDTGRGIPVEKLALIKAMKGALGVGIAGMRERLRQLGGELEIESGPKGTTVRATLPLTEKET